MGAAFPPVNYQANNAVLRLMAVEKQNFARSAIDAATVMIIQATLDSAVNEYLVLLARAAPTLWEPDLREETVKFAELKSMRHGILLEEKALVLARSLTSKSLPKKVQTILDRCYRGDVDLCPPDFRFDLSRLKVFDDARHDVAHGRGMGIVIGNMDELLLFLWQTLLSLEAVIGARLGFSRNPGRRLEKARLIQPRTVTI